MGGLAAGGGGRRGVAARGRHAGIGADLLALHTLAENLLAQKHSCCAGSPLVVVPYSTHHCRELPPWAEWKNLLRGTVLVHDGLVLGASGLEVELEALGLKDRGELIGRLGGHGDGGETNAEVGMCGVWG